MRRGGGEGTRKVGGITGREATGAGEAGGDGCSVGAGGERCTIIGGGVTWIEQETTVKYLETQFQ